MDDQTTSQSDSTADPLDQADADDRPGQEQEPHQQETVTVSWPLAIISSVLYGLIFTLALMVIAEEQSFIHTVVTTGWGMLFWVLPSFVINRPLVWLKALVLLELAVIVGLCLLLWKNEVKLSDRGMTETVLMGLGFGLIVGVPAFIFAIRATIRAKAKPARSPAFTRRANIVALIFFVVVAALFFYRNQCEIVECEPASWATIYAIAQREASKTEPASLIGAIRVEPEFRTKVSDEGPYDLTVRIELLTPSEDPTAPGWYDIQQIEFNDRAQWVTRRDYGSTSRDTLSEEARLRLQQLTISPRDAYRITWPSAQAILADDDRSYSSALLIADSEWLSLERLGVEAAWLITYQDSSVALEYWVDARTGKLLESTQDHYRER